MSVLHRRDAAFAPRARGVAEGRLLEGLASHALLALVVARLAARVAWHAITCPAFRRTLRTDGCGSPPGSEARAHTDGW